MMEICKADFEELNKILELQYLAYKSEAALFGTNDIPPLKQTMEEVIQEYRNGIILKMISEDNDIIGSVRAREDNGTAYIGKLMVHPDYRCCGCGTKLLTEIEKFYPGKRYELFTSTRSEANIRLYQRNGYTIFDRKPVNDDLVFVYMEKTCDSNKAEVVIGTERLFLREMNMGDYEALYSVLADSDNMQHYPYAFDEGRVRDWIERNMERYRKDGFGLWAVCLKDTGEVIGDCGLTLQDIEGEMLPEIGYHIRRGCQCRGYAKEAASAVRDWAFKNTDYPALYSYCKYTNIASIRTAEAIGMQFDREYPDEANRITHVSVIYRRT